MISLVNMPSMTEYELTVCMSIMTMSVSAKGTLARLASEATTKPFVSTSTSWSCCVFLCSAPFAFSQKACRINRSISIL